MFQMSELYERRRTIFLDHDADCDRDPKKGLSKTDSIFDKHLEHHPEQILHNKTYPMPCPKAKRNPLRPFYIKHKCIILVNL